MSTCPSCLAAEADPRSPVYHAGCLECGARCLATGSHYAISQAARRMMPSYRAALEALVGRNIDDVEALHRRVKHWAERMLSASLTGGQT